jgi:hypothetical protein
MRLSYIREIIAEIISEIISEIIPETTRESESHTQVSHTHAGEPHTLTELSTDEP